MISRRGYMIRQLRSYIENGLSDLGDFRNCMAYPVGDDGAAEIVMAVHGQEFTFYIEPGSDTDPGKACGVLAVRDEKTHDRLRGPIDPSTWVKISGFVRERVGAHV